MAVLHVKSPNGTAHSLNLYTMNCTWTGSSTNGYIILPNGFCFVYSRINSSNCTFYNDGQIEWVFPIETSWGVSNFLVTVFTSDLTKAYIACAYARYSKNTATFHVWRTDGTIITSNPTPSFTLTVYLIDHISPIYT